MSEHDHSKCGHDHSGGLSRRGFGTLLLAGAASSVLPAGAKAAADCPKVTPVPALAVMCIDYRLVNDYTGFFNGPKGPGLKKYDLVSLAGASLACGSRTTFKETVEGFYQQVGAAWTLHRIQNVVFVDHLDCGAFKVEFNRGCDFASPEAERAKHIEVMRHVVDEFPRRIANMHLPKIGLDFWLFRSGVNPGEPEHIPDPHAAH